MQNSMFGLAWVVALNTQYILLKGKPEYPQLVKIYFDKRKKKKKYCVTKALRKIDHGTLLRISTQTDQQQTFKDPLFRGAT